MSAAGEDMIGKRRGERRARETPLLGYGSKGEGKGKGTAG
jgi:hypothetical protein